jgi:[ribosomal protein S18]-alanine N-acetyltransferase
MTVSIRRATLADVEALVALERDFPSDRLSRRNFCHLLTRANADVHVCLHARHVIGNAVVLYRRGGHAARLYSIVVSPAARGRGAASALLRAAETGARRRHCERVTLEVRPGNNAAIRLYEKFGYAMTRRIAGFYQDGRDALRFERTLRAGKPRRR